MKKQSISRRAILLASISALLSGPAAHSATYYWDTNPSTVAAGNDILDGGAGLWNNAAANFTTDIADAAGVNHNVWSSVLNGAGKDTVVFGGATGGTVTLNAFATGGQIANSATAAVNNLTFNATGDLSNYTLTGTGQLRFVNNGAVGGSITVGVGVTAIINNAIQGGASGALTTVGTADGNVDALVDINGGGLLRLGGGNGSVGFNITGNTTVEVTGGSFSGFNLSTVNAGSTLRTTANNVLQTPSSLNGDGLFDINGTTQTTGTLGGALAVTNSTSTANATLNLSYAAGNQTHTGVISNGAGKLSLAVTGAFALGNGFNSSTTVNTQTFAGANTYTGSTSLGRGTTVLDFSNAAAPASNIFYNGGFGAPTGDDGKLTISKPLLNINGSANSAIGTLVNITLTGKASTTNSQTFNGFQVDANSGAVILINPNATGNTVTLDLGAIARATGSVINFATTNATTALSANAIVKTISGSASGTLVDSTGVAYASLGGRDWAAKNAANDTIVAATYQNSTPSTLAGTATTITAGGAANDVKLVADTNITALRYGNTLRSGISLGGNTLTAGGILVSAASTGSGNFISGGTLKPAGSDLVLLNYAANARMFGARAVIADGTLGATGLTTGGSVPTQLLGNNNFTGVLNVQQSGLIVTGTNTPSAINVNGSATIGTGAHLPNSTPSATFVQLGYANAAGDIGSGDVNLGVGALLAIKRTDAITLNNNIRGIGGVTQGWSGTTTLVSAAAAKYTYVGDTTVTAGTLKLDYAASNTGIISDSSRLVLGGGTVEYATAAGTTHNDAVRDTIFIAGASTVTKTGAGAGRLRLNSFNDVGQAGATVNFTAAGVADADTNGTNGILGSRARFTVGSAGTYDWAVTAGTGSADTAITAFTAYGALNLTAGTDTTNPLQDLTGTVTFTGARTTNSLKLTNSSGSSQVLDIAAANTLTLTSGGLLVTGMNEVQINNGTVKSGTLTNSDLIIHQYNAGGLSIGSVIANGVGASTVTKAGSGALTLSGVNTYTGQTYLTGGTTIISANANLGAVATGAQLNLINGTLRATADVILSNGAVGTNNRNVALNGMGGTFEVDATRTLTIGGAITGPGGLTKMGDGILDIRSDNHNGPTIISAGALKYGAAVNNVVSPVTVGASGTLDVGGFANSIGSLDGAGIVTNSGAAATFSVGALNTDTIFDGQLTNGASALSLDKFGAGTFTLTGSTHNYTGTTTISGGTLALSGAGTLPAASALNASSATGAFDITAISAATLSVGSLAGVAGSSVALGAKTLISGSNNGTTTFAGVISGVGGGITKTATTVGAGVLTISGVNTYTGTTTVDQGALRIRDSVLVNTNGPLGNASSAVLVGTAASAVGTAFGSNILLHVQPVGDSDNLTFARPIDFSQAANNVTNNDRSRFRFESNGTGGLDTSKLTISGDMTFGAHAVELYVDRAGQTLEFSGNMTGGSNTLYLTGGNGAAPTVDGAGTGNFRFSNVNRPLTSTFTLTVGRVTIDGSVGAVGTDSPIGKQAIALADGNGGNTINTRGRDSVRSILLETAGTSYARGLAPGQGTGVTPTAGAQQALYGTGAVRMLNGHQFGGLNTTGTTTFSGAIQGQPVAVSVTGTAGGAGGTNPISIVHNIALVAATGGESVFTGIISGATAPTLGLTGTPGASANGDNLRLTINQFRNHPNIDEDKDGNADAGVANALVGTATSGTVALSGANTYGGGTEILGGTLRIDHTQALSTTGDVAFTAGKLQYGTGITTDLSARIANSVGSISVDTNGNDVTYATPLAATNTGGLTKSGNGILDLAATEAYTGLTTVTGGTLRVSGSISGSATTVTGGALGGTGTTGAVTISGGTLAPGNSPGTLNTGDLTFNSGTFAIELNGTGSTDYDQVNVTGTVSIVGATALTIGLGYSPAQGDSFTLINNDSTDAPTLNSFFTFGGNPIAENIDFGPFGAGLAYQLDYTAGVDGNDTVLTVVPEPTAAVSLLSGLGLLVAMRRRRWA